MIDQKQFYVARFQVLSRLSRGGQRGAIELQTNFIRDKITDWFKRREEKFCRPLLLDWCSMNSPVVLYPFFGANN